MKIISLIENTTENENIKSEHGLSLYIEGLGKKILFDLGQSELVFENAKALGIDLKEIDVAVISHGHYDHCGGLRGFLKINETASVYIRGEAFMPYYHGERYIGIDASLENCVRLIKTDGDTDICEGFKLCAIDGAPDDCGSLTVEKGGVRMPDFFDHEQYLLIEEGDTRVLISGCSHKGIVRIAEHFRPNVLVGGFHFMNMPLDGELVAEAKRLNAIDCRYYTCHCTGAEQYRLLKKYINNLSYLSAGCEIEI